jgi:hypothetical protein
MQKLKSASLALILCGCCVVIAFITLSITSARTLMDPKVVSGFALTDGHGVSLVPISSIPCASDGQRTTCQIALLGQMQTTIEVSYDEEAAKAYKSTGIGVTGCRASVRGVSLTCSDYIPGNGYGHFPLVSVGAVDAGTQLLTAAKDRHPLVNLGESGWSIAALVCATSASLLMTIALMIQLESRRKLLIALPLPLMAAPILATALLGGLSRLRLID